MVEWPRNQTRHCVPPEEENHGKKCVTYDQDNLSTFSKGQKRIGRYILDHYDQAAFMTASKLGKLTEVSESTVVRFAAELGFDGYPAMQRARRKWCSTRARVFRRRWKPKTQAGSTSSEGPGNQPDITGGRRVSS